MPDCTPRVEEMKSIGIEEMNMPTITAAIGAGLPWSAIIDLIKQFGMPIVIALLKKWLESLTGTPAPAPTPSGDPFGT